MIIVDFLYRQDRLGLAEIFCSQLINVRNLSSNLQSMGQAFGLLYLPLEPKNPQKLEKKSRFNWLALDTINTGLCFIVKIPGGRIKSANLEGSTKYSEFSYTALMLRFCRLDSFSLPRLISYHLTDHHF